MMTKIQKRERSNLLSAAYLSHQKGLHKHSYFKIHNYALSRDLVQDTFAKTWKYLVRGGKIEIMKAFLYNVLNNLIIDEYRKRKTVSLDLLLEKGFEPQAETHSNLSDIIDGKAIIILLEELPIKYKKVIRMRFIQDLSLAEMSLLTGQTRNTIAVQVHRGLDKLRTLHKLKITASNSRS